MVANRANSTLSRASDGAPALTPIAFAQAIVLAYRHRSMDPGPVLEKAQIAPDLLRQAQGRMTAWQMEVLSGAAMHELDDEGLGCFSRRLPWGSYGMLARASLGAADLGLALKRWCRHHRLLTDDIALSLSVEGGVAVLSITEHRMKAPLRAFCLLSVLRNVYGLASWFIDSRLPLQLTAFAFAAPPYAEVFPVLFPRGPVRFGDGPTRLCFDARYLTLPLRRDEAAMNQMLQRALPLTVHRYRRDRLLVQRVRQALQAQADGSHNADALAASLHMSARTLHRQLKDEGATLQGIKDEVRRQVATDALLRSGRPIKQVAQLAGFRNEKSFMRAFRLWTGTSPLAFRQQGGAQPGPLGRESV